MKKRKYYLKNYTQLPFLVSKTSHLRKYEIRKSRNEFVTSLCFYHLLERKSNTSFIHSLLKADAWSFAYQLVMILVINPLFLINPLKLLHYNFFGLKLFPNFHFGFSNVCCLLKSCLYPHKKDAKQLYLPIWDLKEIFLRLKV